MKMTKMMKKKMKILTKLLLCLAVLVSILALSKPVAAKPRKYDSAKINRCVVDANTGKLECCGKVNYYMSGDTLYMNKPFPDFATFLLIKITMIDYQLLT